MTILYIDRSKPFNPATFFFKGEGWYIIEEDKRSLALTEVDLSKVSLWMMPQGEDNLKHLRAHDHIRLDAKVFQTLWENQHLIPQSWKEPTHGETTYIYFGGTVLRDPLASWVLCLYWGGDKWYWKFHWPVAEWPRFPAVLAS